MKPIKESIDQSINNIIEISEEQELLLIQYCKMFSVVITGSFYILDISKRRFIYVKPDDLFLCGYSVEEAMKLNLDLYSQIIHPEDLPLWNKFLEIIPQHLQTLQEKRNEIDHISCIFRLIRRNSFTKNPISQMVYQRMIPVWKNETISYLICSVENVSYKKNGFYLRYKNSPTYEKYEPATGSWRTHTTIFLNEREQVLLILSQQGLSSNQIADTLCRSKHTIQNQIKSLFIKLDVHSMQDAVETANHCNLLQPYKEKKINFPDRAMYIPEKKIGKKLICEIQILLDKGKSIRSIASIIGIAESTIRSWITKELLKR